MPPTASQQYEVWGSPVSHSLSPTLHLAAYRVLGLPWVYQNREVDQNTLASRWSGEGERLGGISLTMPLKERILDVVAARAPIVETLGAANTVYRVQGEPTLQNTDPFGADRALERSGVAAESAWILGAGATARAVGHALVGRGTREVSLFVRDEGRASQTAEFLLAAGLAVQLHTFGDFSGALAPGLVASTLPGGALDLPEIPSQVRETAALFDVAYSPWPSHYAQLWTGSPQPVVSGLWMLAYQALAQLRLFVHQDVSTELDNEGAVFQAMMESVGLDAL